MGNAHSDVAKAALTVECHGALHMRLFGPFLLTSADNYSVQLPNRRACALLSMLALDSDAPIDRDQVSKLLWPGRFEAQARASLRQCLLELNRMFEELGLSGVSATRSHLDLGATVLTSDLALLEAALVSSNIQVAADALQAIGLQQLLEGHHYGDVFDHWLDGRRRQIELRLQTHIEAALERLAHAGDTAGHTRLLSAWQVRSGTANGRTPLITVDGKTRIAVLPFKAVAAPSVEDYFTDGMVDELITTLGRVPQLLVAGRTSSFQFRGSALALPEIAAQLRVSHVIEGSVQRQGDHVRIHVHLIDGQTGFELWGERYDGSLDAIFALQESVAQAVTAALGTTLDIPMQPPLMGGMTTSKAAYDLYLQGRSLCTQLFSEGLFNRAIHLLDQAVALDPQFAEAWVALAEAHQLIAVYTPCMDRLAASARMAECARNAIAIAPNLGYAYALLGVHQWTQNDVVGALDLAFKGYGLEPNNPAVAMRLGSFLMYCGRTTEAMKYVEAAIDQDPVDGRKFTLRLVGNFNLGHIDAALEAGQRMVDLGFPSMWLAVMIATAGDHDYAVELYYQNRLLMNKMLFPPAGTEPMPPAVMDAYWQIASKGVCSGREEDRAAYCQMLDMLHVTMHDPADPVIVLPAIFMGYADMVFKSFDKGISPANTLCLLSMWADIEPIRGIWQHPEFIPFAQRIGLAAAWDKYGWPDVLPVPSNTKSA